MKQTLDTISIIVTQYNNTAFTSTSTVRHSFPFDYETPGVSQIHPPPGYSDPAYIESIMSEDYTFAEPYGGEGMWQVVNLTDGQVDATSIPYPSAYIAANAIGYAAVDGPCSQCSTAEPFEGLGCPDYDTFTTTSNQCTYTTISFSLTDTYYEILDMPAFATPDEFGALSNTESAAAWLRSNSYLNSLEPNIGRCTFVTELNGPPRVKIPVSALTGTVTTTIRATELPPSQTAAPASPLTTSWARSTLSSSPQPSVATFSSQLSIPKSSPPFSVQPEEPKSLESPSNVIPKGSLVPKPFIAPGDQSKTEQAPEPPVTDVKTRLSSVPPENPPQETPKHAPTESIKPSSAANPRPAISFAGTHYTQDTDSRVAFPAGTLTPGGVITVSGTPISLAPGGSYAIVGTSTQQLAAPTSPTPSRISAITVANKVYTAGSDGKYSIGSQVLTKGGQITVSGTRISLPLKGEYAVVGTITQDLMAATPMTYAPGNTVVIAGSSAHVDSPTTPADLTFDGAVYTTNSVGDFVVSGQTLRSGKALTYGSTTVSYATDRDAVVIDSSTQLLSPSGQPNKPIITFDGSQYEADSDGDFVIAGQTLKPGEALTLSGTPISYAADHDAIVIGSSTQLLSPINSHDIPIITFGGSPYMANADGDFVIASETLTAGDNIIVSHTPISYGTASGGGEIAIIGSSTQYLTQPVKSGFIVYAGSTFTEDTAGDFIIASQTLMPGGVITVSGTPISYAFDKTDVVFGTSTEAVETGLGGYIISAFGNGLGAPNSTAGATGAAFTGRGSKSSEERSMWVLWMGMLIVLAATVFR